MDLQTPTLNEIDLSVPIPVLDVAGAVAFPGLILAVPLTRPEELALVRSRPSGSLVVQLIDTDEASQSDNGEPPDPQMLAGRVGIAASILTHLDTTEDTAQVVLRGIDRVEIVGVHGQGRDVGAIVKAFHCPSEPHEEVEDLSADVLRTFRDLVDRDEQLSPEVGRMAERKGLDPARLADFVASSLAFSPVERQSVVEASCVRDRLNIVLSLLDRKKDALELESQIKTQTLERIESEQRRRLLEEQLREIRSALGETDDSDLVGLFQRRLENAALPARIRQAAETELRRLEALSAASIEYDTSRHHLEEILDVPWGSYHRAEVDLQAFEAKLNEDLVGLTKPKEEILEFVSVLSLNRNRPGSALCITGPSGVGRGAMARSVARGLDRPFVCINLDSIKGADDLVGRRHTAVGAEPGSLIKALTDTGVMNPVLLLEGLDEMGMDASPRMIRGVQAMLDPARRSSFLDEFLGAPVDMSGVLVLATATTPYSIPEPFLDSLQFVMVSSYIDREKLAIARRHLISKQVERHGLINLSFEVSDDALLHVIRRYTREAGVWQLNRMLATLCRKLAREAAIGNEWPTPLSPEDVARYLGRPRVTAPGTPRIDTVGVAMGLAWTTEGGDILPIEAIRLPGVGEVQLTGQLGDVMRESAAAALSFVRSRAFELEIPPEAFAETGMHINLPEGAIPKDGPSAGLTLAVVIASLVTNRPVRHDVAMTGEITLRGRILPVGGIREKVLGAYRAGIRTVILPKENELDLEDVPDVIQKEMRFVAVDTADEALEEALAKVALPSSQETLLYVEVGPQMEEVGETGDAPKKKRRASAADSRKKPAARGRRPAKKKPAKKKPAKKKPAKKKPAGKKPGAGRPATKKTPATGRKRPAARGGRSPAGTKRGSGR